jgi:hypothetical protein
VIRGEGRSAGGRPRHHAAQHEGGAVCQRGLRSPRVVR